VATCLLGKDTYDAGDEEKDLRYVGSKMAKLTQCQSPTMILPVDESSKTMSQA
jgi:hypothetical protein